MTYRSFDDMACALAAEEALFAQLGSGSVESGWLMWRGVPALVVPRSFLRRPGLSAAAELSATKGWPVVIRQTGGDVVPQGFGTLNLSLAWIEEGSHISSISQGYARICDPICAVVGGSCASVEASFCDGAFNVVVRGRKLAGTAQRRRRQGNRTLALVHAMILVDEDIDVGVSMTNAFLNALGEDRVMRADAHINAAEALGDPHLTPERFAGYLAAALNAHDRRMLPA